MFIDNYVRCPACDHQESRSSFYCSACGTDVTPKIRGIGTGHRVLMAALGLAHIGNAVCFLVLVLTGPRSTALAATILVLSAGIILLHSNTYYLERYKTKLSVFRRLRGLPDPGDHPGVTAIGKRHAGRLSVGCGVLVAAYLVSILSAMVLTVLWMFGLLDLDQVFGWFSGVGRYGILPLFVLVFTASGIMLCRQACRSYPTIGDPE